MDPNEELIQYAQSRAPKLEKFAMKPLRVEFTFAKEAEGAQVRLHVRSQDVEFHVDSTGEDFFHGVNEVVDKMVRQLGRKKSRAQSHKGRKVS
jgi:ribosomal subunit interface protein